MLADVWKHFSMRPPFWRMAQIIRFVRVETPVVFVLLIDGFDKIVRVGSDLFVRKNDDHVSVIGSDHQGSWRSDDTVLHL